MRTMFAVLCVVLLLVGPGVALPAWSTAPATHVNSVTAERLGSEEPLLKKALLVGRVTNVTAGDKVTTVNAVNLHVVFFQPFQTFHFTDGDTITISTPQAGMRAKAFIVGWFDVVLPLTANSVAVMETTLGTMVLELYEDKLPVTCGNFIRLAEDGFYDGLVFHRVIEDFVIQGGGYDANGMLHDSPYGPIPLETNPEVHHLDGTIGMARTNDPDSATSQFFIDDGRNPRLDPNATSLGYSAFGRVVLGIDVVRAIAGVETKTKHGMADWPVTDVIITSVSIIHPKS
jgi:cyclophilin family peptidyl-prolyl cis-trans isomerase